jgi:hypothetical protein
MVDASVVAAKRTHADYGNVDEVVSQFSVLRWPVARRPVDLTTKNCRSVSKRCDRAMLGSENESSRLHFFQQRDLARVVKLVLDDSTKRIEKVVIAFGLARDSILQPRIGEGRNCLH